MLVRHVVPADLDETIRVDRYAAETFAVFASRKAARKACKRGEVLLDGAPVESSRFVHPGDRIEILEPDVHPPGPWPHALEIPWVDDHLAVVVKPPGIPVHGPRRHTLVNALVAALPPPERPDALPWPHPVHRLDIRTGGLLLVARTGPAQVTLGQALEARHVDKRYRALAVGRLEGEGRVEQAVGGRAATSDWRAVQQTPSARDGWLTTVDLWPRTGRTHQLREHLASLGHPVLGDDLYDDPDTVLRGRGLFLWSVEVGLAHPATGAPLRVAIPEPPKFARWREREARRA